MLLREIIEQNKRLVREAEHGSCIYGVLEKIAYHINSIKPGKAPESDWRRAQIAFAYYLPVIMNKRFEEALSSTQIKEYVMEKAYDLHKQNPANSPFDNWIMAQDKLAKLTAEKFKEEEIKVQEIKQKEFDSLCWGIERGVYQHLI